MGKKNIAKVHTKYSQKPKTIGQIFADLCPPGVTESIWKWPPNAFAITSVILNESGAYRIAIDPHATQKWPPGKNPDQWSTRIEDLSKKWRQYYLNNSEDKKLNSLFKKIESNSLLQINNLTKIKHWKLLCTILEIHAISDHMCAGLGLPISTDSDIPFQFWINGYSLLIKNHTLSEFDPSRVKVLPKLRTPQVGISLRSLSHNLCIDNTEVDVNWLCCIGPLLPKQMTLNLLLLPWPLEIETSDFHQRQWSLDNMNSEEFGFFEFEPRKKFDLKYAESMLKNAKTKTGEIHGVILPEASINPTELKKLEKLLKKHNIGFYVAGLREKKRNYARFGLHSSFGKPEYIHYDQDKHHRWLLEGNQIRNYHLGAKFHPDKKYWEAINIQERTVNFLCISEWLTMCFLICEDLARHDPVGNVVRSVGPNLVIALLLDGPQLTSRWASRYASALADDPGSSVLSLTSLGMAIRSRPNGDKVSRVIALWKDIEFGTREIELDHGRQAAVLSLTAKFKTEWSADGRKSENTAGVISFSGCQQI